MGCLDSESDGCVMDEIVLAPEMSPIIFMKSCRGGGGGGGGSVLRQPPWQWLSQSQCECLSNRMLEANFRRFMKLGMAPWMWSV